MVPSKHPLLPALCLYASGLLLGSVCSLKPGWILAALATLLILGRFLCNRRQFIVAVLIIGTGWLNLTVRTSVHSEHDLRLIASSESALATIRGKLLETPRITERLREDEVRSRTLAEVYVDEIQFHRGPWMPAAGRVMVSSAGTLDARYHQGQRVEVSGVLAKPNGPLAQGLFDYADYLDKRGIYFELRAGTEGDWRIPEGTATKPPLTDQFVHWARKTLARGLPADDPATGLLQAMTLGWKTALTDEIEKPFMRSGTMHIFAISGLHIALIAAILLALLRLIRLPRGYCGALLIPLLWFYTAATGWQPSALRATVMMTIILGGWSLRRPSNLLNSLATAALIILIFDPRQLFQASFQLSFAVVLSLSLILPPIQERLLGLLQPDPLIPTNLVPRWQKWLGWPLHWLFLMIATSVAAWVGSMLLTAHYFHLFSPGTLLANVMIVPCATAALASALASLTLGSWWPWGSEVFNHGAWFWMTCMMRISKDVSELPGAYFYVASPSAALLCTYYGALLVLAFGWIKQMRVKRFVASVSAVMGLMLAWQIQTESVQSALTVIPLNGGLSIQAQSPELEHAMLVDCGNQQTFDFVLVPFLHAQGEEKIAALLLTHGDVRHMGAANLLMEQFHPDVLGISDVRFRSSAYRSLVEENIPNGVEVLHLHAGDRFKGWTVLNPPADLKVSRADEGALVLHAEIRGTRVLLLSDVDRAAQRRILESTDPATLRSEIVVTGLPGEGEPLIDDLLATVQPTLIIVGDDEWPPSRRGSDSLYERLDRGATTVLSTRRQGAVRLEFHKRGWTARDARRTVLARSGGSATSATETRD